MKIQDLTKNELLSLIYHHLSKTRFVDHEVYCVACCDGYRSDLPKDAYGLICDYCNSVAETPQLRIKAIKARLNRLLKDPTTDGGVIRDLQAQLYEETK